MAHVLNELLLVGYTILLVDKGDGLLGKAVLKERANKQTVTPSNGKVGPDVLPNNNPLPVMLTHLKAEGDVDWLATLAVPAAASCAC